jgi:hypothetical protein
MTVRELANVTELSEQQVEAAADELRATEAIKISESSGVKVISLSQSPERG